MEIIPKPVEEKRKTDGMLSPSIQYSMTKYFLVLILRILTELTREMLPKADSRNMKPVRIKNPILEIK
jgi:hypothetical protein